MKRKFAVFEGNDRETVASSISLQNNKKLKSIFQDVFHPESKKVPIDEKFTVDQNNKFKSIFSDVFKITVNVPQVKSEFELTEIILAQCLECNYTTTDFNKFYDPVVHNCIKEFESIQCNTCVKEANNAENIYQLR